MRVRLRRPAQSDPARVRARTKIKVCCYSCEHEWDADRRAADAECYVCGAQVGSEDHTIIVVGEEAA